MPQTRQRPAGLIISAPARGHGKTLVTLGLLRALTRAGAAVSGIACGTKFVSPALFWQASGRPSFHLDSWAMTPSLIDLTTGFPTPSVKLALCDGQLGLYDGLPKQVATAPFGVATTADVARITGWPVVLVVDAQDQSQTLAASLKGFVDFDPDVKLAGVILNKVKNAHHAAVLKDTLASIGLPVFGCLPKSSLLHAELAALKTMLYPSHDKDFTAQLQNSLDALAAIIAERLNLSALVSAANHMPQDKKTLAMNFAASLTPPGQRIAIARDFAFSFLYPHVLEAWRWQGAELVFFSPLNNEPPPPTCDACWLCGGTLEPYLNHLAKADRFFTGLTNFASNKPVHGEAGGLVVLGHHVCDSKGHIYKMAGLLAHDSQITPQQLSFGYRLLKLQTTCALGQRDMIVRGYEQHEFTISPTNAQKNDQALGVVSDAYGQKFVPYGSQSGFVSATLCHMMGYG